MSPGLDLSALQARLSALAAGAEGAAQEAVQAAAERAQDYARAICPVGDGSDGGHLRDCIRAETAQEGGVAVGRVLAENPHAAYVEFGTGRRGAGSPAPPKWSGTGGYGDFPGMAAQPYLMPALEEGREAFLENAARLLLAGFGGEEG